MWKERKEPRIEDWETSTLKSWAERGEAEGGLKGIFSYDNKHAGRKITGFSTIPAFCGQKSVHLSPKSNHSGLDGFKLERVTP